MGYEGPLVVGIGAMHGNEAAGVSAIKKVQEMLDAEALLKPDFRFEGRFLGLIGNLVAYRQGQRYIGVDLNRIWDSVTEGGLAVESGAKFAEGDKKQMPEYQEMWALHALLLEAIEHHRGHEIVIIDLHTTSADGGIFSIALDGEKEWHIAQALHAPMVKGLLDGIGGTLLHYCKSLIFKDKRVSAIAFEGGSHFDPLSVDRLISALINTLKAAGCVAEEDVNTRHDAILKSYAEQLPAVVQLDYVHHIDQDCAFTMKPGYVNFQTVKEGEHLADDCNGPVLCKTDGLILMPLYQAKGTDGFFIVKTLIHN